MDKPLLTQLLNDGIQRIGVCGPLHQLPVHIRDTPLWEFENKPPGGLENTEIRVHVAMWTQSIALRTPLQQWGKIVTGRHEYNAPGRGVPGWPAVASVTVQPPCPLQQHVHRTQVGDQQVGIDVQGLFKGLGPHYNRTGTRWPALA